jgi:hypothetical protein
MRVKMAKKKMGRPPRGYDVRAFSIRLPVEMDDALEEAAREGHRQKSEQLKLALEEHLVKLGKWPPANGKRSAEPPD